MLAGYRRHVHHGAIKRRAQLSRCQVFARFVEHQGCLVRLQLGSLNRGCSWAALQQLQILLGLVDPVLGLIHLVPGVELLHILLAQGHVKIVLGRGPIAPRIVQAVLADVIAVLKRVILIHGPLELDQVGAYSRIKVGILRCIIRVSGNRQ